jgi:hypothetical protein
MIGKTFPTIASWKSSVGRGRRLRQQALEQERPEAVRELAVFRCRWRQATPELLSAKELRWLSGSECKEMLEVIEAEIAKRQPQDEPRMTAIVGHPIVAVVARLTAERQGHEQHKGPPQGRRSNHNRGVPGPGLQGSVGAESEDRVGVRAVRPKDNYGS